MLYHLISQAALQKSENNDFTSKGRLVLRDVGWLHQTLNRAM